MIAPAPCCLVWCPAYPDDIYRGITDTPGKHPILKKGNYSNIGMIGHSMGGNAVLKIAADSAKVVASHIKVVVPLMPAWWYVEIPPFAA